jgi:hypothetical protein
MTVTLQSKAQFDALCRETDFTARFRRIMAHRYAGTEPSEEDLTIADDVRDQGWELVHYAEARGVTSADIDNIMRTLVDPLDPPKPRTPNVAHA